MKKRDCFVGDLGTSSLLMSPEKEILKSQAKPSLCVSGTVLQTVFAENALNIALKSK